MRPYHASLHPAVAPRHAHAHERVRRLGEPMFKGNRVQLLRDGPQTFEAMFQAIDSARDHINIESYIVAAQGPGEELASRLVERGRAGVKVNLLFDSFGSLRISSAFFARLARPGVSLCEYNPVQRRRALVSQALHLRDHRRLMVVDGCVGFIGGVDVSPVHGSWPVSAGRQSVGVAACDAGRGRNPSYRARLGAIDTARSRVLLTTAYLVPPRRLLRSLTQAAERNVAQARHIDAAQWAHRPQPHRWKEALARRFEFFL